MSAQNSQSQHSKEKAPARTGAPKDWIIAHGKPTRRSPASNSRRRLPQRRSAIAVELEHAGHRFRMQIGRFPDGVQGEVFLDAAKQNSALDALAADAAILISLLLQHGATPAEIGHALRRAPDGTAASLIGAVVDRLVEEGAP